jgi:hypothetical protein
MKSLNPASKFNWRSFASLMLFLGFLVMLVSGVILYISPRGRTANWSGWEMIGLGKDDWASVHITAALVLIAVAGLHLFFNWSIFLHYLKSRRSNGFRIRRELAASIIATGLCFFGTLWELPPFSNVLAFNSAMKDYWDQNSPAAPVAHAEELTLAEVAEQAMLAPEELVIRLQTAGFSLPDQAVPFKEIAKQNNVTPNKLYEAASIPVPRGQGNRERHAGSGGGGGFGRMTLGQLCTQENIALDQALQRLEKLGVNASETQPLRDLAGKLGMSPFDVLSVLKSESSQANEG